MTIINTNELNCAALDWAVAKCEGYTGVALQERSGGGWYSPSTNWAQGGPIIEREKISVECKHDGWWVASYQYNYSDDKENLQLAENPLIAALRCYVASKLGDEVDIPHELI